jgi:hypothetical protein
MLSNDFNNNEFPIFELQIREYHALYCYSTIWYVFLASYPTVEL